MMGHSSMTASQKALGRAQGEGVRGVKEQSAGKENWRSQMQNGERKAIGRTQELHEERWRGLEGSEVLNNASFTISQSQLAYQKIHVHGLRGLPQFKPVLFKGQL